MSNMDEQGLLEIMDRLKSRYYGKYRGAVTEVDEATMRIKAKVPAVLGDQTSGWCMPCVPYAGPDVGFAFLPEVGAGVWIEFEGGDLSYPIWVGGYWREGELPDGIGAAVKVIVTKSKHKIVLDDDATTITISDDNGNTVTLDSNGITLDRGSKVVVSDSKVDVNNGSLEVT